MSSKPSIREIAIDVIRRDGGTQLRAKTDTAVVAEYAEAMRAGDSNFPPITVFKDGDVYWLADGFHRITAATEAGLEWIACDVREGDVRAAKLHAATANANHGLRRTNADKRNVVTMFLLDDEWSKWSDNRIAKEAGVSHPFVGSIRSSLVTVTSEDRPLPAKSGGGRAYTTKHGASATMNTANIGGGGDEIENKNADDAAELPAHVDETSDGEATSIGCPWSDWSNKVRAETKAIATAATNITKLIGVEKEGRTKSEFAYFMHSNDSTVGLIREGINNINDALPVAPSDKQPGFIPQREQKMRDRVAKGGK